MTPDCNCRGPASTGAHRDARDNQRVMKRSVICGTVVVVASFVSVAFLSACGSGRSGGLDLGKYENSRKAYFYVGRSFDGLRLSNVQPYQGGVAEIIYGTCKPPPDGGCPPPLELQHRLCRGRVTVVIYIGANPKPGRAARAAHALRPLSDGARRNKPLLAFDRAPAC
jgi:hypothetical protein